MSHEGISSTYGETTRSSCFCDRNLDKCTTATYGGVTIVAALSAILVIGGVLLLVANQGYNLGPVNAIAIQFGQKGIYATLALGGSIFVLNTAFIAIIIYNSLNKKNFASRDENSPSTRISSSEIPEVHKSPEAHDNLIEYPKGFVKSHLDKKPGIYAQLQIDLQPGFYACDTFEIKGRYTVEIAELILVNDNGEIKRHLCKEGKAQELLDTTYPNFLSQLEFDNTLQKGFKSNVSKELSIHEYWPYEISLDGQTIYVIAFKEELDSPHSTAYFIGDEEAYSTHLTKRFSAKDGWINAKETFTNTRYTKSEAVKCTKDKDALQNFLNTSYLERFEYKILDISANNSSTIYCLVYKSLNPSANTPIFFKSEIARKQYINAHLINHIDREQIQAKIYTNPDALAKSEAFKKYCKDSKTYMLFDLEVSGKQVFGMLYQDIHEGQTIIHSHYWLTDKERQQIIETKFSFESGYLNGNSEITTEIAKKLVSGIDFDNSVNKQPQRMRRTEYWTDELKSKNYRSRTIIYTLFIGKSKTHYFFTSEEARAAYIADLDDKDYYSLKELDQAIYGKGGLSELLKEEGTYITTEATVATFSGEKKVFLILYRSKPEDIEKLKPAPLHSQRITGVSYEIYTDEKARQSALDKQKLFEPADMEVAKRTVQKHLVDEDLKNLEIDAKVVKKLISLKDYRWIQNRSNYFEKNLYQTVDIKSIDGKMTIYCLLIGGSKTCKFFVSNTARTQHIVTLNADYYSFNDIRSAIFNSGGLMEQSGLEELEANRYVRAKTTVTTLGGDKKKIYLVLYSRSWIKNEKHLQSCHYPSKDKRESYLLSQRTDLSKESLLPTNDEAARDTKKRFLIDKIVTSPGNYYLQENVALHSQRMVQTSQCRFELRGFDKTVSILYFQDISGNLTWKVFTEAAEAAKYIQDHKTTLTCDVKKRLEASDEYPPELVHSLLLSEQKKDIQEREKQILNQEYWEIAFNTNKKAYPNIFVVLMRTNEGQLEQRYFKTDKAMKAFLKNTVYVNAKERMSQFKATLIFLGQEQQSHTPGDKRPAMLFDQTEGSDMVRTVTLLSTEKIDIQYIKSSEFNQKQLTQNYDLISSSEVLKKFSTDEELSKTELTALELKSKVRINRYFSRLSRRRPLSRRNKNKRIVPSKMTKKKFVTSNTTIQRRTSIGIIDYSYVLYSLKGSNKVKIKYFRKNSSQITEFKNSLNATAQTVE